MRILVTGASGFLGFHLARRLAGAGHSVVGTHHRRADLLDRLPGVIALPLDLADPRSVGAAFESASPDVVVHCAAMPDLGPCQRNPDLARCCNTQATVQLAQLTSQRRGRFVFISTDQVFDGEAGMYAESDEARPLHVYGETKLEAERATLALGGDSLIVRIALVYGDSPSGARSASEQIVNTLCAGEALTLFTDEYRTPIHVADVTSALVRCVMEPDFGPDSLAKGRDRHGAVSEDCCSTAGRTDTAWADRIIHLAGPQRLSRYEFGAAVARAAKLDCSLIRPAMQADVDLPMSRPKDLSLRIERARAMLDFSPRRVEAGLAECAIE